MKSEFIDKIAKRFHNVSYFESNDVGQKNLEFMEKERLKTTNKYNVTLKINQILGDAVNIDTNKSKVFVILDKIYRKNQKAAFKLSDEKVINSDLLNIVADESLLMVAYNKIRKDSKKHRKG